VKAAGLFAAAEAAPDRPVLVEPSGHRVTAADLVAGMNRVAKGLLAMGLTAGDTVAVVLSNRREFLECYGAAIQSGLYFVAVNWHLAPNEISYILEDSRAQVVVTEERFATEVAGAGAAAGIDPSRLFTVDFGDGLRSLSELIADQSGDPPTQRSPGQIMFYTSGTTGRPKGVRKSFRAEASDELTLTSGIGPIRRVATGGAGTGGAGGPGGASPDAAAGGADLVYINSGPFYHALPIAGVVSALDSGGTVVVMDKWTPETFLDLVREHRVTNATLVPTMFHRLLSLPDEVRDRADVSSLRFVNHAGAPCPIDVKRRMIEWWGPIITEAYSSTEGAGTSVTSEEWLRKPGTVGRASPGVTIKVLDGDGNECQTGQQGLVYMTPSLWDFEYHHDHDKTQAARHGAMFTVGDIGYLDEDGYLFLCDRQADTIISGGVNIYPAEIEAALLQHAAVRDVAVIGVPNEEWGEEVRAVVELEDPTRGSQALAAELIEFCQERIARFKCPRGVDFVESLARDPNGKLRKGVIRAGYWPDQARRI
jgi:long-chain acyl-CoA synthetase